MNSYLFVLYLIVQPTIWVTGKEIEVLYPKKDKTVLDSYTFSAALFRYQNKTVQLKCGAALIKEDWIVTAVHCFIFHYTPMDEMNYYFVVRTITLVEGKREPLHRVQYMISHPFYENRGLLKDRLISNDIAVAKLRGKFQMDNGATVGRLPTLRFLNGKKVAVMYEKCSLVVNGVLFSGGTATDGIMKVIKFPPRNIMEIPMYMRPLYASDSNFVFTDEFDSQYPSYRYLAGNPVQCGHLLFGFVSRGSIDREVYYYGMMRLDNYEQFFESSVPNISFYNDYIDSDLILLEKSNSPEIGASPVKFLVFCNFMYYTIFNYIE